MNSQDNPLRDNRGEPLPSLDVVFATWLSVEDAMKVTGLSRRGVQDACVEGRLRAYKVGSYRRGYWLISPESAEAYERRTPPSGAED